MLKKWVKLSHTKCLSTMANVYLYPLQMSTLEGGEKLTLTPSMREARLQDYKQQSLLKSIPGDPLNCTHKE